MNNAKIALDNIELQPERDPNPLLRAEESRLLRIIEAIEEVDSSKAWSSLKTEVFDPLVNILEKGLREEARKENPDPLKLNRLSGELKWAERFSDLSKLEASKREELVRVRINLYGKSEN